jgi:HD-GYP domain-containing protein (c-di-GMP phosphodiesterase class II)
LGGSTSFLHLRFAAVSLIVALLIGAVAVLAGRQSVTAREHEAAAQSAARLFSSPLQDSFEAATTSNGGALTSAQRSQVDALVAALIPSELLAVRVYAENGSVLYASDGLSEPRPVPQAALSWRRLANDGGAFATTVREPGYVAELTERAAPIDAKVAQQQRVVLVTVVLVVGLLYVLLQGAFWLITRSIRADHQRLVRLYISGAQLRASLDFHDVMTQLTRDATNAARGDFGVVALYDHETGDMLLRATFTRESDTISHHQRAFEEWYMRRAIITNTTIITGQNCDAFHQFYSDVPEDGRLNALCVPMTLRDRVLGVVTVLRLPTQRRNSFAPDEVRQVVDLAVQGAMAVEQADLFQKVRAYADEVELSYDSTLKALTAALDAKDDVTEGHCERVSRLTSALARDMGIDARALVDIERGALLHDVGKIGVPDAVLKKPDALNAMEWEAIRKHPLLAGVMISKVGFLEGATPILMYHHERFDGTGYPFGLSGDNIPLEARIFSVVDAYDAITSDRPYRAARQHETAMSEIAAHSGTQFDPNVVRSFQKLMAAQPHLRAQVGVAVSRRPRHDDDDGAMLAESVA